MKIAHLVNTFAPTGGIETYVIKLLPLLEKQGYQNLVLYRRHHPRTPSANGRLVFHIPYGTDWDADREEICRILNNFEPDVVYMHDVYDALLVQRLAKYRPTVGYVHIFYPVCPGLGKLFHKNDVVCEQAFGLKCIPNIYLRKCASAHNPLSVRKIYRRTRQYLDGYLSLSKVVVASEYMYDLMHQNNVESNALAILPPHFINPQETEKEIVVGGDGHTILFVGRLEYEKGIPYLLEVMTHLPKHAQLFVTGDGSLQAEYEALSRQMNLQDRVQFLGWVNDNRLDQLYRQATVVVVPSIMPEPFGKVGIEAMVNGCPVVAFDVGGISDWLKDGENGFLVPPLDVKQFAKRVSQLLDDADLAQK